MKNKNADFLLAGLAALFGLGTGLVGYFTIKRTVRKELGDK